MADLTTSSINPSSLATQLATAYTQASQGLLDTQSKNAQATGSALTKLQSALQTFDSALASLSGKQGVTQYSSTFSTAGFGTATASATAQPGTYSLFVERLASANQMAYQNLSSVPLSAGGTLTVHLAGGSAFAVDFTGADMDGDGNLSPTEVARAINQAPNNQGQVNALLVSSGGQAQLLLSAASTGAASQISLDTSGLAAGALKNSLDAGTELVPAQDAVVWMGAQGSGLKLQQASNTFSSIPGVTMTFTQAQAAGAAPLALTVAGDDSATAANVRSFADAYNALNKALDQLTDTGSADGGKTAGAFVSDAGVRALRSRLNALIHQPVAGLSLLDFGVSADRDGNLSLDQAKLTKTLAAHPDGLDTLFGRTGITTGSGVLGALDKYLDGWLNSSSGQIKWRQTSVQSLQKALAARQTQLDDSYDKAYQRYLDQFSRLQALQSQMSQTTGMFAQLNA